MLNRGGNAQPICAVEFFYFLSPSIVLPEPKPKPMSPPTPPPIPRNFLYFPPMNFNKALPALALLVLLTGASNYCQAQVKDAALIKKLSINGLCLCNTTLDSLRAAGLKDTTVEEMDTPPGCIAQDSRYVAGMGYYSSKYPGMIFQRDQTTNQISKIRLTRQFKGKLPDGTLLDLQNMRLKDLFKLYPKLKDAWGSRGCSTYWNFSNDTLSFFVKIDTNKKPQFPIDEAYYLDKPIAAADLVVSCYSFSQFVPKDFYMDKNPGDPIYFLDSIRMNRMALENFDPADFVAITVVKGKRALELVGQDGKNGVIYIETKDVAKRHYWAYFKSRSKDLAQLPIDPKNDSSFQFILNGRQITGDFDNQPMDISDKNLKSISVIGKDELAKNYGITGKNYGVIILADLPPKKQ